jgi:hypothetical protein
LGFSINNHIDRTMGGNNLLMAMILVSMVFKSDLI